MVNTCVLRAISCISMAICKNYKYSENELQRFLDRLENVLNHDECRNDFRCFLKEIRRNDLVKILDIWELANDIRKNVRASPERTRKNNELKEKVNDEPSFSAIVYDPDNIIVLNERASEHLSMYHRFFIHYLRKKYR